MNRLNTYKCSVINTIYVNKMTHFHLTIPNRQYKALRKISKEENIPIVSFIRSAIDLYLKENYDIKKE